MLLVVNAFWSNSSVSKWKLTQLNGTFLRAIGSQCIPTEQLWVPTEIKVAQWDSYRISAGKRNLTGQLFELIVVHPTYKYPSKQLSGLVVRAIGGKRNRMGQFMWVTSNKHNLKGQLSEVTVVNAAWWDSYVSYH